MTRLSWMFASPISEKHDSGPGLLWRDCPIGQVPVPPVQFSGAGSPVEDKLTSRSEKYTSQYTGSENFQTAASQSRIAAADLASSLSSIEYFARSAGSKCSQTVPPIKLTAAREDIRAQSAVGLFERRQTILLANGLLAASETLPLFTCKQFGGLQAFCPKAGRTTEIIKARKTTGRRENIEPQPWPRARSVGLADSVMDLSQFDVNAHSRG